VSDFALFYRGREYFESPAEGQKHFQKWVDWFKALQDKGVLKEQGHALEKTGKVVRRGAKTINDGPFAEAKDVIGGFSVVEASSLEEATEFASGCPILEVGGSVEIRPLQNLNF
jgi:hypothetical protein